jgi:hypothetical protein
VRIALLSDIHADFIEKGKRGAFLSEIAGALRAADVDVVIMAGDVANRATRVGDILAPLAVGRIANLYIPGNHDVYLTPEDMNKGRSSWGSLNLLRRACAAVGWIYLPGNSQIIAGWGFAGSLGWYDYSYRTPSVPANDVHYQNLTYGKDRWLDRDHVRWTVGLAGQVMPDPDVAALFTKQLGDDLHALGLDEAGNGPPTVVTTHMLPYRELVRYTGETSWDFFSAFMGTPTLGALYDTLPAIRGIFAGHTHTPFAIEDGDGRQIAIAPFGYVIFPDEWPSDFGARIALFDTDGNSLVPVMGR